ncbi:MAG: molecular chaperone [Desulfovibrio sp.]|nr:molecular chaperone [Desulfovibrio sp.]
MKILGIDLGTSNTYIYLSRLSGDGEFATEDPPEPVVAPKIADAAGSVATVVMYEDDRPFLIGNLAESEFYANIEARPLRRLESQFKPEIASADPAAMRAMTDFLAMLKKSLPEDIFEGEVAIYVGMPSLSREDYKLNLNACFLKAGWPSPSFARESDAALVSCLQSGIIEIDDLSQKCLILDFGGGTCDYTTIENTEILQNGGDLLYGGRLFDDLFFQVFCQRDPEFARDVPASPYEWFVHWIECKEQKEAFSDHFYGKDAPKTTKSRERDAKSWTLRAVWYDASGNKRESYARDYSLTDFIKDAENYLPTEQASRILAPYRDRGGVSAVARDMLEGRRVGLIAWLKTILENISPKNALRKIILTGGSSRWFFVRDTMKELFPNAVCLHSVRGYEDIAYGLALYPMLMESRERTKKLIDEKLPEFSRKVVNIAVKLADQKTDEITRLCADRIVEADVMPTLDAASRESMSIEEIEKRCAENIKNDGQLLKIADEIGAGLREEAQKELDFALRKWLRDNGVLLVPNFRFPADAIGMDFSENVGIKISRLDALNIMRLTITKILPALTATAAAGAILHSGEAISTIVGGSLAFGATWALAKTAPSFLEKRKLPKFFLNEKTRQKIAEKNRYYLETGLRDSLKEGRAKMAAEIERRLKTSLEDMLTKLSVLNQVKVG